MDGNFRKNYPTVLWPSLIIPPIVFWLALNNLTQDPTMIAEAIHIAMAGFAVVALWLGRPYFRGAGKTITG